MSKREAKRIKKEFEQSVQEAKAVIREIGTVSTELKYTEESLEKRAKTIEEEYQRRVHEARVLIQGIKRTVAEARMIYARLQWIIGVLQRPTIMGVFSVVMWLMSEMERQYRAFLELKAKTELLELQMERRQRLLEQAMAEVEAKRRASYRAVVPG